MVAISESGLPLPCMVLIGQGEDFHIIFLFKEHSFLHHYVNENEKQYMYTVNLV